MSEKLLNHPLALCNMVRRIAIEAGDVTLDYFEEMGFSNASTKDDGSPVTAADVAAEKVIKAGLKDILPDVPIIAEESVAAGQIPSISDETYFWCVDPLDGTKEFISGSGDYTVNIALIKGNRPVLGVVYAPVKGDLYAGAGEGTAIRWSEDTKAEKEIHVRKAPAEGYTVVASRNHSKDAELEEFLSGYKVNKLIKRGSSLKICAIAAGKADIYPRLGPTCEWDTAAGHSVLLSAGGALVDMEGKPFTYGHADRDFLNPFFIAASQEFIDDYREDRVAS